MSGSFFGLNIARSGLFASQRHLHVTGHNIANANTPGYSRQRLDVSASDPMTLPGGQGMIGTGVDTDSIRQIRDAFLDFKIRQEFTTGGEWEARAEALQQMEAILNEPSDSGIRKVMDEFFSSLQELSKNPENNTTRAQVRQRGIALTKTLNHMYNQMKDMQKNTDFAVETTVNQINGYANQIASLNNQIFRAELDGSHANDLRDQRNLLIDQLSQLVNIEVQEEPVPNSKNGATTMKIMINGHPLVSHSEYKELKMIARQPGQEKNYVDESRLLDIEWEDGTAFHCKSGKLKGLLDMRDNMGGNEKGIPYYMDQLNRFTTIFTARFNLQHRQGYGLAGAGNNHNFFNEPAGVLNKIVPVGATDQEIIENYEQNPANKGKTIFKVGTDWYEVDIIQANGIDIASDIEDLNNIAAATTDDGSGSGLSKDGSNALNLSDLRHDGNMFTWGTPDDFFKSMISNLGVDGQEAIRMVDNQGVLITQIDNKRQSVSGVSLDEEMTNMVKFQHAYNASARMITTVDEMLDKVINGMGVVGR